MRDSSTIKLGSVTRKCRTWGCDEFALNEKDKCADCYLNREDNR
jgi:hypothetical protein